MCNCSYFLIFFLFVLKLSLLLLGSTCTNQLIDRLQTPFLGSGRNPLLHCIPWYGLFNIFAILDELVLAGARPLMYNTFRHVTTIKNDRIVAKMTNIWRNFMIQLVLASTFKLMFTDSLLLFHCLSFIYRLFLRWSITKERIVYKLIRIIIYCPGIFLYFIRDSPCYKKCRSK